MDFGTFFHARWMRMACIVSVRRVCILVWIVWGLFFIYIPTNAYCVLESTVRRLFARARGFANFIKNILNQNGL